MLEQHHTADRDFKTSLTALVSLSSRIVTLFDGSQPEEKRKLIGFVFSNLELDGQKLRFTLRKPFDLFVNLSEGQEWRPIVDRLRTVEQGNVIALAAFLPHQFKQAA